VSSRAGWTGTPPQPPPQVRRLLLARRDASPNGRWVAPHSARYTVSTSRQRDTEECTPLRVCPVGQKGGILVFLVGWFPSPPATWWFLSREVFPTEPGCMEFPPFWAFSPLDSVPVARPGPGLRRCGYKFHSIDLSSCMILGRCATGTCSVYDPSYYLQLNLGIHAVS
jgi:hypothetical protein